MTPELGDWLVNERGYFKIQMLFDPPYEGPNGAIRFAGTFYSVSGCINTNDRIYWSPDANSFEIVTDEELLALLELRTL